MELMKHFVLNFFFFFFGQIGRKERLHARTPICRGEPGPIREELRLATTIGDQSD